MNDGLLIGEFCLSFYTLSSLAPEPEMVLHTAEPKKYLDYCVKEWLCKNLESHIGDSIGSRMHYEPF